MKFYNNVYACAKTYLSRVEMMIEWLKNWFVSKGVKGAIPSNWITWLHNQIGNFKPSWL
jgi:NADH:ubiquinone oxidoreductase subunit